jgi:nucleoside-diphosphate-sugar epimerase
MSGQKSELFILGANGFIGKEVVKEALGRGFHVKALVRDCEKAGELATAGAQFIQGDAAHPTNWIEEVAKSDVLIDLVQPQLPNRIGLSAVRKIAASRLTNMERLLVALETIPPTDRPLLMAVSGLDDLAPDQAERVHDESPLRTQFTGFSHIGVPVRRLLEQSKFASTFAYLGTVYGPGKAFAQRVFPQLATGRFRLAGSGDTRMPLVHVEDAARALVHLATLPTARLIGRSFVVADKSNATMATFAGYAAKLLGAPAPRTVPIWLARLVLGKVLCETLTRDIGADSSGLLSSGFEFRYPSYVEGLPPTLNRLGYETTGTPQKPIPARTGRVIPFWILMIAAVGSLMAENLLDFPLSAPRMMRLSGGLPLLDIRLWYSEHIAYQLFEALGATGRSAYLHFFWSVDLCLPFLFALFLSGAIKRSQFRRLSWLPALAAACDYAENIAITVMLLRYPDRTPTIVLLSSTLTSLKWVGYLASIFLAITGFLLQIWKRMDRSNSTRPN